MTGVNGSSLRHGDFSTLADDYALYRPGYSEHAVDRLIGATGVDGGALAFADIGAGTGIWTRMLAGKTIRGTAVEPCDEMRAKGEDLSASVENVAWIKGSAEDTGLADESCHLVTMASAFHWADFEKATDEFKRVLKPGGVFGALWNTRKIDESPLFTEIEETLYAMAPHMKRVSSGKSEFCDGLLDRLKQCPWVEDAWYGEFLHTETMSTERYLGIWRSVNDIRVQAGPKVFDEFLRYVENRISRLERLEPVYMTKLWYAKKNQFDWLS